MIWALACDTHRRQIEVMMSAVRAFKAFLAVSLLFAFVPAAAARTVSPNAYESAHAFASDYLEPIVRPDTGKVRVEIPRCRVYSAGWDACRVLVSGTTSCSAVARLRPRRDGIYVGWMPRLNCR
jgi:hypothetical protein